MQTPLSSHRYPTRSLTADYARTAIGLLLTAGPLFLGDIIMALRIILIVSVFIFLIFGLRTFVRRALTVELFDQGIRARGLFTKSIDWQDLKDVRLNFFSTRRDHEKGWMQLRLIGSGGQIRLDDSIEGFDHIVGATVSAALARHISLGAATVENLAVLGISPGNLVPAGLTEATPSL